MRINLSFNFAQFSFSDHLWEASSLAGNFLGGRGGGDMDFLNWSCHFSDFDRKAKRCATTRSIFLFSWQSLKHSRINSKSPSSRPEKKFPPKRKLLKDDQKTKIVQNLKINWYALGLGRSGASSSHKIQKTFWKILEIFRN